MRIELLLQRRYFHSFFNKKPKKANDTAFKKYFRLTIADQPISPFRKGYEIWKTNPIARKITNSFKWFFAIGFIFYWKEGTSLPG